MTNLAVLIAYAFLLLGVVSCQQCGKSAATQSIAPVDIARGRCEQRADNDSLRCILLVDVPAQKGPTDSVDVRVELKNIGHETFTLFDLGELPDSVTLTSDKSYPRIDIDPTKSQGFSGPKIVVQPGMSRTWEFNLHKFFQFSAPGQYNLTVEQPITYWTGTTTKEVMLQVSDIQFKVTRR